MASSPAPADVAATSPPARPEPPADSASPDGDISDAPASASHKDDRQDVQSDGNHANVDQTSASKKRKRTPDVDSPETPSSNTTPPLPADEVPPPLPNEEPPAPEDDGWDAHWDPNVAAYYFHNRYTGVTQWENPRVPDASSSAGAPSAAPPPAPGTSSYGASTSALGSPPRKRVAGYNPAIHGDYDPNADYAREYEHNDENTLDPEAAAAAHAAALGGDSSGAYAQSASFNRFTGRFQAADLGPDRHNDESKSRRQLNAYFDVDAAANSHNGMSLKAERQNKKLTKKELKAFREKAAKKKEEKRRAWLRD
ncbi:WW domain-containing protein [Phyllosticta citriasiana]|uniref:WW domain-containing protein n=1 Tax=Phyllosticta citriasiana TaxID=595635 RepID=A0ABR1KB97_9PEZI